MVRNPSMKKHIAALLLLTGLGCTSTGWSTEQMASSAEPGYPTDSMATMVVDEADAEAGQMSLEEFEKTLSLDKARLEDSGKFSWVGYAYQTVSVGKAHPNWGKSRVIAAQKAIMAAENNFAKEFGQKISSEKIAAYYNDGNEKIPDFDPTAEGESSQWKRIYHKLTTLAERKIDQSLADLGLDPKELELIPEEQRYLKFRDAFKSTINRSAIAELSGLLTFKTYEGFDNDGQYQVGVMMVLSPRMKQLAWDLARSKGNIAPVAGKAGSRQLNKIVTSENISLIPDFGVKRLYDRNGYPVLVSFGQWAISSTGGNGKKISRKRAHAYKQAEAQADQALAEFLNSRINYSDMNESGEESKSEGVVDEQNFKSNVDITSIIDITRENSVKKSKVNIVGIRELRRWSAVHPQNNSARIVGVIRYWSPVNEKQMRAIRKWKPSRPIAEKRQPAPVPRTTGGIQQSQERMSLDDF
ncbi:hypothetical protein DP0589 [Desulfotalea psychrophila LSv54]|uniref:DUF6844 domain-containing protein n=2 Tax=Desulfotalea psychrophila TaxID=84980 RepID=Q6AQQ5_DESPS|nr:hypothetical protein DP0589 [Desulfotalea psychrophila LSv54]